MKAFASARAINVCLLPWMGLLLAVHAAPLPAQQALASPLRTPRQVPRPVRAATDPVVLQAEQLFAAGDTVAALATLDAGLRQAPRNAARWHHAGLVRWMLAVPERSGGYIASKRTIHLLIGADSALRLAT